MDGYKRLDRIEKKNSKLKDRSKEIIKLKNEEKKIKLKITSSETCGTISNDLSNIHTTAVPEAMERKNWVEEIFKDTS